MKNTSRKAPSSLRHILKTLLLSSLFSSHFCFSVDVETAKQDTDPSSHKSTEQTSEMIKQWKKITQNPDSVFNRNHPSSIQGPPALSAEQVHLNGLKKKSVLPFLNADSHLPLLPPEITKKIFTLLTLTDIHTLLNFGLIYTNHLDLSPPYPPQNIYKLDTKLKACGLKEWAIALAHKKTQFGVGLCHLMLESKKSTSAKKAHSLTTEPSKDDQLHPLKNWKNLSCRTLFTIHERTESSPPERLNNKLFFIPFRNWRRVLIIDRVLPKNAHQHYCLLDLETRSQSLWREVGHYSRSSIFFFNGNNVLASANNVEHTLSIIDIEKEPIIIKETPEITSLTVSPSGKYTAVGLRGGAIKVWSSEDGMPLCTVQRGCRKISALSICEDEIYAGNADGHLYTWDIITGEIKMEKEVHRKSISSIFVSEKKDLLITRSAEEEKTKISKKNGTPIRILNTYSSHLQPYRFDPLHNEDPLFPFYTFNPFNEDEDEGEYEVSHYSQDFLTDAIIISPDETKIAVHYTRESKVIIYDIETFSTCYMFPLSRQEIICALSNDHRAIIMKPFKNPHRTISCLDLYALPETKPLDWQLHNLLYSKKKIEKLKENMKLK